MVDACQIPASILKDLTTTALAQTCLNYPLFFEHTALNDERKGIANMIEKFNGLKELSLRKDGFIELIKLYKDIPTKKIAFLQSKGEDIPYKSIYVELLLADDSFLGKMDTIWLKELKEVVLEKYQSKLNDCATYSLYNIGKTLLLAASVMDKINASASVPSKNKDKIREFIRTYDTAKPDMLTEISKIISTNE